MAFFKKALLMTLVEFSNFYNIFFKFLLCQMKFEFVENFEIVTNYSEENNTFIQSPIHRNKAVVFFFFFHLNSKIAYYSHGTQ